MTGVVQTPSATGDSAHVGPTRPLPPGVPISPEPSQGGWHRMGWFAAAAAGALVIVWFIFFSRGELGSKADWFFGAVVFCVVLVAMWQTLTIQRLANRHAAQAAERLRVELVAAEERAAREVAMTQALHRVRSEERRVGKGCRARW